jgi:hypothetical protein
MMCPPKKLYAIGLLTLTLKRRNAMPENPAEMPAEGEGGSGTIDWSKLRGGIGGPNEIPIPDFRISASQLVNEVFRLRNRVHVLESGMLAARMRAGSAASFFGGIGGPNELPEGEGGGGGEIHELHEIHEIAEMPIGPFIAELGRLVARFTQFERSVLTQLATINQRLDSIKR